MVLLGIELTITMLVNYHDYKIDWFNFGIDEDASLERQLMEKAKTYPIIDFICKSYVS